MTAPQVPAPIRSRYGLSWQLGPHEFVSVRPAWAAWGCVVTSSTPGGPLVTHAGYPRAVSWDEGERIGAALVARLLGARQVAA